MLSSKDCFPRGTRWIDGRCPRPCSRCFSRRRYALPPAIAKSHLNRPRLCTRCSAPHQVECRATEPSVSPARRVELSASVTCASTPNREAGMVASARAYAGPVVHPVIQGTSASRGTRVRTVIGVFLPPELRKRCSHDRRCYRGARCSPCDATDLILRFNPSLLGLYMWLSWGRRRLHADESMLLRNSSWRRVQGWSCQRNHQE
jgi:hypothetical protein